MAISRTYPGVYAAMATPVTQQGEIDRQGVRNVVDYLFANGVTGLSILGSTGENPALTISQRQEVLETSLEAASGRGPVFTGAAATVVSDIITSLKTAAGTGAEGALVPPPYYYPLGSDGVVAFYERIAEASPLPIIMYNIPRMTKIQIGPDAVERLAGHPNIMGLKDSSGDFGYFSALARTVKGNDGFTLYTGSDAMLASALFVGGHGCIGGAVNTVPAALAELYRAYQRGDYERAVDLQGTVAKAVAATGSVGTFPAAIKGQYELKGVCGRWMAPPIPALTDAQLEQLRQRMTEAGLLEGVAAKGA